MCCRPSCFIFELLLEEELLELFCTKLDIACNIKKTEIQAPVGGGLKQQGPCKLKVGGAVREDCSYKWKFLIIYFLNLPVCRTAVEAYNGTVDQRSLRW